jgi:uncharacterized Fe-S cluster-containing radical SAM superfamily protein
MIPSFEQTEDHLHSILARGSVNLGEGANTERLMLMLTRSCHLRCGYCWVQKTETGSVMKPELASKSVDWLMRSKREKLEIQFFGGEPTSEWDTLLHTLHYARHHPMRQGRRLEFVLTTNGLGLQGDRLDKLTSPDLLILFSLDGTEQAHRRFRPPHIGEDAGESLSHDAAWSRLNQAIDSLNGSGVRWFMNAVIPPADADGVMARYEWALDNGIPALQLNYAVGMEWPQHKVDAYLMGLIKVMQRHRREEPEMMLYNWRSECEPVMLSDDLIVDVDGTVLHDGAIFLERGFPELRSTYMRGPLHTLDDFDSCRWSLEQLNNVMCQTYEVGSQKHQTVLQNIRMGAAVDWVIQALRTPGDREI